MAMIVENEKIFEYFSILPSELRVMLVDEMEAEDRCRFTRCSKLSQKEAKASKNYIYALKFQAYSEKIMKIYMIHGKYDEDIDGYEKMPGFIYVFEENHGKKQMRYELVNKKKFWEEKLDKSNDLAECSAERFKEILMLYQNKVKHLRFQGYLFDDKLKNYDFGLTSLNNLEGLGLESSMDIQYYFSKLRNSLKWFLVQGFVNRVDVADCNEIYQVRDYFFMINTSFTNEQMLRLTASIVTIHIGNLTVMDIYNYIRSWQNGSMENKRRWYTHWDMMRSSFDLTSLFRRLGVIEDEATPRFSGRFEIKHFLDAGKSATLRYINTRWQKELTFYTDKPKE